MKKLILHANQLTPLAIIAVIFGSCVASFAALTVDASLSHTSFPIDRGAMLTVTVTGESRGGDIDLPEIPDIRFHQRDKSSRFNMVNGNISFSSSQSFLVEALNPGKYTIPPINVVVGKESAATQPITFTVTGPGQQRDSDRSAADSGLQDVAFITVSKTGSQYLGEVVPITLNIYLNRQYKTDISSLPILEGDGVVMEPLSATPAQTQENRNGRSYHVISWNTTLTGIKTGLHKIRFRLDGSLLVPLDRQERSPLSSFGSVFFDDSFFNDIFGGYRSKPFTISSPELTFDVAPLPAKGKPENYSGAIGSFDLAVSASPVEIEPGEPITLVTRISGSGNFDRIEPPRLRDNTSWKTYSPTEVAPNRGQQQDGHEKIFEQAVIVKNSDITEIPPLNFSYFDPALKKYITKTSTPIPLTISTTGTVFQPGETTAPAKVQKKTAQQPTVIDRLAPLHLELGTLTPTYEPLYRKSWYLGTLAAMAITCLGAGTFLLRQRKYRRNPLLKEQQERNTLLAKDLDAAQQALSEHQSQQFLLACRTAIQNQLGRRFRLQPHAISTGDIEQMVGKDSELSKIFTLAQTALYAGTSLSADEMERLLHQLKKELETFK
ncbi:BatD family protein [Desulforhopalus singaporensis]|uniref:Oxygen tolerance n=1 Tax=Desulforhopalus singaporensis TaxID=91360 RepID=A0A1H0S6K2_9BACT|nr:BatD family protein [Desulforhopalus singaporensis]SDP37344.1 Oxygen tolerance [Desulforhopalus singaporensis]